MAHAEVKFCLLNDFSQCWWDFFLCISTWYFYGTEHCLQTHPAMPIIKFCLFMSSSEWNLKKILELLFMMNVAGSNLWCRYFLMLNAHWLRSFCQCFIPRKLKVKCRRHFSKLSSIPNASSAPTKNCFI